MVESHRAFRKSQCMAICSPPNRLPSLWRPLSYFQGLVQRQYMFVAFLTGVQPWPDAIPWHLLFVMRLFDCNRLAGSFHLSGANKKKISPLYLCYLSDIGRGAPR